MTRRQVAATFTALMCIAASAGAQSTRGDSAAFELLHRARVARLRHDSALTSYDATAIQRLTLSVGVRATGPQRIAYRHEDAARIRWSRDAGSWIELLGARSFMGAFRGNFSTATDRDLADAVPLPYFPGRERLWSGDGMVTDFVGQARATSDSVSTSELVNPLARGAESFYEYAIGDSLLMALPNGKRITLRELRITARRPQWNLVVGSFWFDDATADLVRAIYRLSTPTDILAVTKERGDERQVPGWLRGIVSPLRTDIEAIGIEFGLVEERFWLPRVQWLEGTALAGPARAMMRIEHRFTYASVNAALPAAPTIALAPRVATGATRAERERAVLSARAAECAATGQHVVKVPRYGGAIDVVASVPCDRDALARSPLLPPTILAEGEDEFDAASRRELLDALGLGLQAGWAPQRGTWSYGLPLTRYNRVEGLSTGVGVDWSLGSGYSAGMLVRGSVADRQLNGELAVERTNGRATIGAAAYRRLAVMNDWGEPLSLTASFPALLFGRDDGAYFRAAGFEVSSRSARWGGVRARVFAERQRAAEVESRWSVFGNRRFALANPIADPVELVGFAARATPHRGDDPRRWRSHADVGFEAATGTVRYARGLVELGVSHGIGGPLVGSLAAAVGSSIGELPLQRRFYLGGASSVRGHRALAGSGDAFWLGRAEIGADLRVVRPTVFADLGWAGDRDAWREIGRPMAGAGVGASVFDGLLRIDVARGVEPVQRWRLDVHLTARF